MTNQPIPEPFPDVKAMIVKVLTETGFAQKRPAKMANDDFLSLLDAFNAVGIHFR